MHQPQIAASGFVIECSLSSTILADGCLTWVPRSGLDERRQRRERMRQDLKVLLVFFLFLEVIHSVGYISGWW
jgi:hypothetical protein